MTPSIKVILRTVDLINQNVCVVKVALDESAFKIIIEIVLEPVASSKHQQIRES